MANDKKFIVKNGLQTSQNVVIGTTTDNGQKLQVTGESKFSGEVVIDQSDFSTPSLKVTNSAGSLFAPPIAEFVGDSDSLQILNSGTGDYKLVNSQQNNGIIFYDSTPGVRILYNNSPRLAISSSGNRFYGLATTTIDNNRIITTADEGPGNGFDADTVDGLEGSQLVRSDVDDIMAGNYTIQQDLTVSGNLTVSGTTTTVESETVLIADNIITLNSNYTGGAPSENAGIEIERGTLNNPKILWDESTDYWKLISLAGNGSLLDLGRIITTADEGSGNGFDADTVDGLEASQFLRSDADDTATGNITIEGDLTIGDDGGPAQIVFNGSGQDRALYSTSGTIGFLNASFNYAARSTSDDDWLVGRDVNAGRDLIATTDVTAGVDITATAGNITASAGNIEATLGSVTAGTTVSAGTTVTAGTDVIGQRFIDADDNAYLANPASNSIFSGLGLDDNLFHNGNTDTRLRFETDNILLQTGGNTRLDINNTRVQANLDTYVPNLVVNDAIIHNNDVDTKVTFDADSIGVDAGGATQLTANTSGIFVTNLSASNSILGDYITALTEVQAPIYYDSNNRSFYGDFAGTSVINGIALEGSISHNGDADTYITFPSADTFGVYTGGTLRYSVDNNSADFTVNVYAPVYYDSNDNNYYGDFHGTSVMNQIDLDSYIRHNGDTDTYFGFVGADQIRLATGGAERLYISNASISAKVAFDSTVSVTAPIFYDGNDATFYLDPASGSRVNTITMTGTVVHDGDTDTFLNFPGANRWEVQTGGAQRLEVNDGGVNITGDLDVTGDGDFGGDVSGGSGTFTGDVTAPRFVDADDTNYFADPAGSSELHEIQIDDYVRHRGNTTTYLGFPSNNNIRFATDGTERLLIDTTYVTSSLDGIFPNLYAGRYYDSSNATYYMDPASTSRVADIDLVGTIRHDGDTDTYINFPAANQFEVVTGGSQRLRVQNGYVLANNQMRSPVFYDNNDTNYYGDFAGTSQLSALAIDTYMRHRGDTTTYLGFDAADSITFVTDNVERVNITNTNTTVFSDLLANRFVDRNDNAYYVDPANTTTSAVFNGKVLIGNTGDPARWDDSSGNGGISFMNHGSYASGQNTTVGISGNSAGGYALMYMNIIDASANPYANGNRYINFYHDGANGTQFRGDSSGNFYIVPPAGTTAGFWDTGGGEILVAEETNNNVIVGGSSVTYTSMDNTPLVGSITNSKLHVNGGIQLNGNDDAIVFGRGTSSFLKDEELGFGWGGGWYMTDATYLRVRNNKALYSTGPAYFSIVYDSDDVNYYTNPASTSQMNRIDIEDYIRHRGDTNTFFGFEANDTFRIWTNGTQRFNIDNNSADFAVNVYAPRYYDSNSTAYYIEPGDGGKLLGNFEFAASSTATGYSVASIELRESNYTGTGAATPPHIGFHWGGVVASNIAIEADGTIAIRNNPGNAYEKFKSAQITTQVFYDMNDTTYRLNPNGSGIADNRLNRLTISNGTYGLLNGHNDEYHSIIFRGYPTNATTGYAQADRISFMEYSGDFRFYRKNGSALTELAIINTDYLSHYSDVRAPIFYDSNNTAYYGDFASRSVLNQLTVGSTSSIVANANLDIAGPVAVRGSTNVYFGVSTTNYNSWQSRIYNRTSGTIASDAQEFEWGNVGYGSGAARMFFDASEGRLQVTGDMRAPIFYDRNDTNYYVNPNSTSRLATLRTNRIYFAYDNSTNTYIDWPGGNYGSMSVHGNGKGGWQGYSIADRYVFMSADANESGIYNDIDNEWMTIWRRNGSTELYFNGGKQAETENGYFLANNQMRAPIYYDSNDTNYYGNFASGNTSTAVRVNGIYDRLGFQASGNGSNNILLRAQDYTHWIWQTATNWGIFWAGNNNPAYSYFSSSNPNEIVFVGSGNVRASIDLDNGNAHFNGTLSAGSFALNGGNENIELVKSYGSGGADLVLFDGTEYFDKRVIKAMAPNENALTSVTSEFVRTTDGPFAGSYVLQSAAYRTFYSDYIPVVPGEEIYGEISHKLISGSGGRLYYGIERFDSQKRPIAGNTGTTYFVAGGSIYTNTSWQTQRAHTTIPTSHTPYNGSDGGGCYYVRIRILMNYNAGGALRQYGGIMLKRRNAESNLIADDIRALDRIDAQGIIESAASVRAPIFYDTNDTNYYTNPASESRINSLRTAGRVVIGGTFQNNAYSSTNSTRLHFGGGDGDANGNYYIGTNKENYNGNYNKLDLRWHTGIRMGAQAVYGGTRIYNNEDLSTLLFSVGKSDTHTRVESGNLYVMNGDARAQIFYDIQDTAYYANPNATSRFYEHRAIYRMHVGNETDIYNGILAGRADLTVRDQYPQINLASHRINNGTHGPTLRFMAYDSANASTGNFKHWVIGIAGTNATSLHFGYSPNQSNPHYGIGRGWSSGNNVSIMWIQNDRQVYTENSFRAPIFYDRNNTNYYIHGDSTSELYDLRLRGNFVRTYAHSGSDFTAGTLVRTSIPAAAQYGASFVLEATGKSYSGDPPFSFTAQGYLYNFQIINYSGQHFGKPGFANMQVFEYQGFLHFWWPRVSYWNSFAVHVRNANGDDRNTVTSITNSGLPGGRTKERTIVMKVTATYNQNINTGDMYAKRYYDSDNTNYYADPHSTSRMNTLSVDRINYLGGAPAYFYTSSGNLRGYIRATETNDSHFEFATSGNEDIIFRDGGFGGSWNQIIRGNGHVLINARLDVPIMYDRNDTAYYTDPRSNTRLNTLEVVSTLTSNGQFYTNDPRDYWSTSITGLTNAPISTRNRDYNVGGTSRYLPLTHQTALYSSGYRTHVNTGLYKYASGWGGGRSSWYAAIGGNDSYPTQAWYLAYDGYINNSLGYVSTFGSFRAPIFYDTNNTGRYLDPNNTSRLQRVEFYGRTQFIGREGDSGGSGSYAGGRLAEYMGNVAAEFHSGNDQPVSLYFRSGVNAPSDFGYITYDPDYDNSGENGAMVIGSENDGGGSSDYIRLQARTVIDSDSISSDNTTMLDVRYRNTTYSRVNTDYLDHISDIRAPIFYDRDNTGYYGNFNSTSQFHYVLANNWFRAQGSTGFYFQDYGKGMRSPEAEGNSYGNVSTYGTGRNGWYGWGIRSRHVLMSTGGDNIGIHDNSRGWLMYWNGSYMDFNYGYTRMNGSARSPIFYDLNDTGYRWNGASDNSSRFRGVDNLTMAFQALSGQTRSSAEYYKARPRITGDTNYWTGAMGWSRIDMNTVADWGSGFIDSWSNPGNQPSGTSHWVGVQSYHYTNGSARYGWQMVGGPVTNLRFRSTWSSFRTWRTIPVMGENSNNTGGLYADIFYDSNNSNYFCDPAGRSRLSSIDYGNSGYYFRSGSWGWRHQTPYGYIEFGPANGSHAHIYTDRSNFYFNVNEMYMNGRAILKENYWNGNKYFGSDGAIYGTIFYDTNNSGYYINPASGHSTRFEGVNNRTMAWINQPGHTRNSGEYYRARPRITSDTNYWTGAMGWGRQDMNVVSTWGSGFIDSWSNPPNQPSGTSHWVGVQSYHYRSSNTGGYGWQMVGGPITNLRFRSSWSGWRSWRTIPVLDENSGNTGSMYAGRYYDANSTGYYMDPASTSNYSTSQQNGYHTFLNYGIGVTGTYTSTRLQQVFAMGSSYRLRSDGNATNNMYGIAWSHPNAGSKGGANQLNDHGMLIINNGSFRAAISSRAVFSSDIRSPIFYDWNSTGYYLDPHSTSNSALRIRGGTLHGPNPSWGEYLAVGTNGRWSGSYASVATTNGNLHLDSKSNRDMYLQWYTGRTCYINATVQDNGLRYYRSNTGLYIDIRGTNNTSRMGRITLNDGVVLRSPDGNYGSFCVDGASRGGYEGFSIGDRVVMMHNNGGVAGMYNDVNNEWMMRFDLNSYCILYHNGSEKLRTRTNGIQAQGFFYSSDERLKENIVTIENAVDKVKKLRGVEYNWKDSGDKDIGLIAQEVQEVIPEVVVIQDTSDNTSDDPNAPASKPAHNDGIEDVLSIEYGHMVGLLVEAVKEQQEQIESQANQIEELKGMVQQLLKG